MSTTPHSALVLFGSGPGIGRNVAALFAERRFRKVILLSRNAQRLEEDAAFVRKSAADAGVSEEVDVSTTSVDLADSAAVTATLSAVGKQLEGTPLEAVLYNAAHLVAIPILEYPTEELETDLRVCVAGGMPYDEGVWMY